MKMIFKRICNWIKKNVLIIVLLLLLVQSVLCVLKFSRITVWEVLPEQVQRILVCPEEGTNRYEIFSLFNNLSLAYIASFIFYFIVEYVPVKVKEKKAYIIISSKLVTIYDNLSYIIRVVMFEVDKNKNISDISLLDLKEVTTVFFNTKIKYARIKHLKNGEYCNSESFSYDVLDNCKTCSEKINNAIDEIFDMQVAGNICNELIEVLSEIRQSSFLHMLESLDHEKTRTLPGVESQILSFDKSFWGIIQYREKLGEYHFDLFDYCFEKMSDEEIKNERESRIYYMGRSCFRLLPVEKIKNSLSYMTDIKLDEQKFHKLNGVLMEILVTYDFDRIQYGYLISVAKDIAEFLCGYDGSETIRDMATLNYLQVLRRIGDCTKDDLKPAEDIVLNINKAKVVRLGALIILKNYAEAQKVFDDLTEDEKKQIVSFPIYRLWEKPLIPASVDQPDFRILR